ncbi:MAG TPA: aminopeptidase [Pantanalinema sp.]
MSRKLTDMRALPFPSEYRAGAFNAINRSLQVRPNERVVVISDRDSQFIGAALIEAIELAEGIAQGFVVEDYCERPILDMPYEILKAVSECAACLYTVNPRPGEVPSRAQVINLATVKKVRYGHMVGITGEIMNSGMRADFDAINKMSLGLRRLLQGARRVHVTTPAGTDIEIEHDPKEFQWIKTSGKISRDAWGNLPGGEIFTTPKRINGIWVADAPIGDYFSSKYGDLKDTPLTLEIQDNFLKTVTSPHEELAQEFWGYTHSTENANRVGEIAVGTNLGVTEFTGNLLQDEKIPGFHIAFGEPCGCLTGANWTCRAHIDLLARECSIWADGQAIMLHGRFVDLNPSS